MKRKHLFFGFILLVLLLLFGLGAGLYSQASRAAAEFEEQRPKPGAALYDQEGRIIKRLGTGSVYVPLDSAPRDLQRAVQSTNDARSVGVYLARQIIEPKGLWSRLQLALLPSVIQRRYSERERWELFLNQAYFGEGAVGMEAASQTYFQKPVQEISLAESALLAALIQEPEAASPFRNPDKAREMRASVLAAMREMGHINSDQEREANQAELNVERREPGYAHHFSDYVGSLLADQLGRDRVLQGGLRIATTIERELQLLAEEIIGRSPTDGALVALSPDGRILALVGGREYKPESTNLALSRENQVGSTLRPLIYAAGLQEDWAVNHLVEDIQRKFDELEVENAGDRYWGTVTMKHALVMDLHNAAIWTLNELGLDKFAELAQAVGLKLQPEKESLALAMGEVRDGLSLLQLTAAFLPAVNEGTYQSVKAFSEVKDSSGRTVLKPEEQPPVQVLTPQQAYLLTDMLLPATVYGSISGLEVDFPAALTASASRDGGSHWAVGYTPELLVGVLLRTPEETEEDAGSRLLAGEVWLQFVKGARELMSAETQDNEEGSPEQPAEEFTVPKHVETGVAIDVFTGLLANERCPQVEVDAFIAGTKPTRWAPCALPPEPEPEPAPVRPRAPQQQVPAPEPEPQPEPKPEPVPEPEPEQPEEPVEPVPEPEPEQPEEPTEPVTEPEPAQPEEPLQPVEPEEPEENQGGNGGSP